MKICSGSSDCMLMPPRKCSSQTSMSTAVVRNSTCATMATREATMEWWWLPMIPCAMAITCRLRQPRKLSLSPRAAGKEEDAIELRPGNPIASSSATTRRRGPVREKLSGWER